MVTSVFKGETDEEIAQNLNLLLAEYISQQENNKNST